jgi:long-chain acyl-CoA synthetase
MKASTFIEQIMVVGENQKYCGAVIVPAFENLKNWAKENGVTFANHEELIAHPKVIAHLQTEVDRINKSLDRHEQVKQFQLLPKEWTIEAGELTPTMKVKRRIVMDKYKSRIAKIFEAA